MKTMNAFLLNILWHFCFVFNFCFIILLQFDIVQGFNNIWFTTLQPWILDNHIVKIKWCCCRHWFNIHCTAILYVLVVTDFYIMLLNDYVYIEQDHWTRLYKYRADYFISLYSLTCRASCFAMFNHLVLSGSVVQAVFFSHGRRHWF